MLKGLELSEVRLSELEKEIRIDAELYNKNYATFKSTIKRVSYTTFSEECSVIKKGIFDINSSCYCDDGIPFVRISNLKDMAIDTADIVHIPLSEHQRNYKTELLKNDIILSKTAIPAASIVDIDCCNVSQDTVAIKLKPNSKLLSHYVVVFLNTKYGLEQMQRRFTGNIQMHLNLEECKNEVLIPVFPLDFQKKIKALFENALVFRKQAKSLYAEAEEILLSELGLKNWQPSSTAVNIKKLKESFLQTGRLDSECYLPCYEDYVHLVERYRGGYGQFASVCTINEANYVPSANEEYTYIELGNIGSYGNITGCTVAYGKDLPSRARRVVHTNDVVLSSVEGSLQSCALVTAEYENAICSTGFYVVRSDVMNPETLLMLFKSELMQNLFKRNCSGTILTAVSHNELHKIIVPKIRAEVQAEIAENVQKSISLRNEAKSLLEDAKGQVENTIQTGGGMYRTLIAQSVYHYRMAEWLLLQELLSGYWTTLGAAAYSVKSFSDFQKTGRLDAEFYQPKYDALEQKLSAHECKRLGDIVSIKKSVEPGSECYKESGIPFVRVSDVSELGITSTDLHLSPADFSLEALRPHKDTILLSKDGSIGIAYKCEQDMDVITSGALLHLTVVDSSFLPDYVTLVLNSIIVRLQAERDSNGAIIQHWKPDDIKRVIIPMLALETQRLVAEKIQRSFALRSESKRLLEQAKRMVEAKIEERNGK